jgi:hypothetical protein
VVTHRDVVLRRSWPGCCGGRAWWSRSVLIVKGYTDVGDGFAAGVVVALAIALFYVALGPESAAELALPFLRYAPVFLVTGLLLALIARASSRWRCRRTPVQPPPGAR